MKHVVKGTEPPNSASWRAANPLKNWGAFARTTGYQELKEQLVNEQACLCCYCEVVIASDHSAHVEHFKPQSRFQKDIFRYTNLLASCQERDSCGHEKQSKYFSGMVSPLDSNCHARFTYTQNGQIIPVDEDDGKAKKTIETLGLDGKRLRHRRLNIIRAIDATLQGMSKTETRQYLKKCLRSNWVGGFHTVIQYVAAKRRIAL